MNGPSCHGVDCEPLYKDGRLYDLQSAQFTDDIPFYCRQIAKYGDPVLELACGTGRVMLPLADRGYRVTGLDVSEGMLRQAASKSLNKDLSVTFIRADCRQFVLKRKFNVILFPFNAIAHLHDRASIEACFSCVQEHLEADGRFIIDFFNPRLDILLRDQSRRYKVTEFPHPDGIGRVVITENNVYDDAAQINRIKWYYSLGNDDEETVEELNMRIFFPQELDSLLYYSGFAIEHKYGDYDESPFQPAAQKQLIVCSKR